MPICSLQTHVAGSLANVIGQYIDDTGQAPQKSNRLHNWEEKVERSSI